MFVKPDKWLTPGEVAELLGVSRATVNRWRRKGMGPAYTRLGATIRYTEKDIESWVSANTIDPAMTFEPFGEKKELVA